MYPSLVTFNMEHKSCCFITDFYVLVMTLKITDKASFYMTDSDLERKYTQKIFVLVIHFVWDILTQVIMGNK